MSQPAVVDADDRASAQHEEAAALLENGAPNGSHEPKLETPMSHGQPMVAYIYAVAIHVLRQLQRLPDIAPSLGVALLPSFVKSRIYKTAPPPAPAYKTAYLDGLRGVASFCVFIFHMVAMIFHSVLYTYGYGRPGENRSLWQLPIIRLIHAGHPMVSLFFVVSGFALSIGPVKHMRRTDSDRTSLHRVLSSAVFRRPIRLFLPSWISTIFPFILIRLGVQESTRTVVLARTVLTGGFFVPQVAQNTTALEFSNLIHEGWKLVDLNYSENDFSPSDHYNDVLWTIPIEFRASLYLYLTHLCLSHLRPKVRYTITSILIVGAILSSHWDMLLFWGGYLLAELDAYMAANPELEVDSDKAGPSHKHWEIFYWVSFVCGLYFASYPGRGASETPGFRILAWLVPSTFHEKQEHRFWEGIGSLLIVLSVSRLSALSGLFSKPLIRYLGQISFALYLVHWTIVSTFGVWVFYCVFAITGRGSAFQDGIGWLIAAAIQVVMAVWAADLFWRYVDIPSVKFGKWLEGKLVRRD